MVSVLSSSAVLVVGIVVGFYLCKTRRIQKKRRGMKLLVDVPEVQSFCYMKF